MGRQAADDTEKGSRLTDGEYLMSQSELIAEVKFKATRITGPVLKKVQIGA